MLKRMFDFNARKAYFAMFSAALTGMACYSFLLMNDILYGGNKAIIFASIIFSCAVLLFIDCYVLSYLAREAHPRRENKAKKRNRIARFRTSYGWASFKAKNKNKS